jgi:hypothetical protein
MGLSFCFPLFFFPRARIMEDKQIIAGAEQIIHLNILPLGGRVGRSS